MKRMILLGILIGAVPCTAAAHEGWGIVRDAKGRIYVSDIPANTVWRIDRDGSVIPLRREVHSHALVLGADGYVYGTHVHFTQPERSVWRVDEAGRVSAIVPSTRGLPLDLQAFHVTVDGTIYSTTPYEPSLPPARRSLFVVRRSTAGVIDTIAGGLRGHADGNGREARFSSIDGMAWLPDGSLILIDGPHVRRLTIDGAVETIAANVSEIRWDQDVMGASVAPNGVVHVADFANRRVLRVVGDAGETVARSGFYWSPTGVLTTDSVLFTLEHPRAPIGILGDMGIGPYLRVRMIRPDGSTQTLALLHGRNTRAFVVGVVAVFALVVGLVAALGRFRVRGTT